MIKEFKEFIANGSAFDLAIGVLIGGAFSAIVKALTDSILGPIVNYFIWLITGSKSGKLSGLAVELGKSGIIIDFGIFVSAIITFFITMLVLFFLVKAMNKVRALGKPVEEELAEPTSEEYLREIVELLKEDKK